MYRKNYSRGPTVDSTRREICGSVTSGTLATFTDEVITLPNIPDQSFGLRIHEFSVEFVYATGNYQVDASRQVAILATNSGTAEQFLSDPECIAKISTVVNDEAAGTVLDNQVKEAKLYPPRIVMGTQFHVKTSCTSPVVVHFRIVYSLIKLSMAEALAALTTMQF